MQKSGKLLKRLKPKLPKFGIVFLCLWLLAILFFFVGVVIGSKQPNRIYPDNISTFLAVDVITGILSFGLMCVFFLLNFAFNSKEEDSKLLKFKKNNKKVDVPRGTRSSGFNFIVIIVAIGLMGAFITYAKAQIAKYPSQPLPTLMPTNTPIPTPSPTVTPKPYVNPDPITDCVSSYPNCKGESIRLKQSQCSNITCCQVGNTWSIYASVDKCKVAQSNVQTPKATQFNLNDVKSNAYTMCSDAVKGSYDLCSSTCKIKFDMDMRDCGSVSGLDQYTLCLDGVTKNHGACLDKCLSDSNEGLQKCLSVWN